MDFKLLLDFLVHSILPLIWTAAGPAITVMVTSTVNKLTGAYVPRSLQIPLAGIASAVLSGLSGGDPATEMAAGSAMQTALSLSPKFFLASAKEDALPAPPASQPYVKA